MSRNGKLNFPVMQPIPDWRDQKLFQGFVEGNASSAAGYGAAEKIKLYTQEYMARNGKKPSPREIAEEMDLSVERVLEVLEMQQADNILSLDSALAADSENFSLGNVLGQEDASFEHVENHDFINYCMSLLNDTEKKIIEQRYLWEQNAETGRGYVECFADAGIAHGEKNPQQVGDGI